MLPRRRSVAAAARARRSPAPAARPGAAGVLAPALGRAHLGLSPNGLARPEDSRPANRLWLSVPEGFLRANGGDPRRESRARRASDSPLLAPILFTQALFFHPLRRDLSAIGPSAYRPP